MKPATAIATVPDEFNPLAVASVPKTHNQPPEVALFTQIDDLFDEAKNFADGEPITSEAMHDAMTELRDRLHKAGVAAEALRKDAVKPHDDAKAAIQLVYNPYVKDKTGKVALGKSAIDALTGAWRQKVAAEKAVEARRVAEEATKAKAAADAAIQASSGNLAAREEAEELLVEAKRLEKTAARTWKAATVGTGLRTTWIAAPDTKENSEELRLDWAFAKDASRFVLLVQQMADEAVRSGARIIPGFVVTEEKRAS